MSVAMSIRAKGLGGYAIRAASIAWRFKVGQGLARRSLKRYLELTRAAAAYPTLPITAVVMRRHTRLVTEYAAQGVEFAIHGLVHNDHAVLGLERQLESIARAARFFEEAGVPFTGFRGPYLRYSQATDAALRALGIRYHSSQAIDFPALDEAHRDAPGYRRALAFYGSWSAERVIARPRLVNGLVHIPVSLPDDEIMVERLRLPARDQTAVWRSIFEATRRGGELFTIMLHPERIFDCGEALEATLDAARSADGTWIARLDEIADWWCRRAASRIDIQEIGAGRYRAVAKGDPRAAVTVTGQAGDLISTDATEPVEFCSSTRPWIGVSPRAPEDLVAFLCEEGYRIEVSHDRHRFSAYVEFGGAWNERELLASVESAGVPLVRLARWPAGVNSVVAVTGDIDSLTVRDFAMRLWENR